MGCVRAAFGFSDTWQLVINTTTTIITFLMVFVIRNTQNRQTPIRAEAVPKRPARAKAGKSSARR